MSEPQKTTKVPKAPKRWIKPYDPLTSLILVIPVFLTYHLGLLFIGGLRNGADVVSGLFFELLEQSTVAYVGVTLAIAAGLSFAGWWMRATGKIRPVQLLPVLLESTALAMLMMITVGWAIEQLFAMIPFLQVGPLTMSPLQKLVMAAGAGFHEELVFRVVLFGGMGAGLAKVIKPGYAWVIAAIVSSLLFSGVHYIGELGDDFRLTSFVFRFLSGVYLAIVFRYRGFAVAVYTHAIYDLFVFFLV